MMAELIHQFPDGEKVVTMAELRGVLFVATTRHVYYVREMDTEYTLVPVRVEEEPR